MASNVDREIHSCGNATLREDERPVYFVAINCHFFTTFYFVRVKILALKNRSRRTVG